MNRAWHLKILSIVTFVWAAFWLIGLPEYYQQYSFNFMLASDLALLIPLTALCYFLLKQEKTNRRQKAVYLAFYCTVPFFIYDYLYCGLYLGHGLGFLTKYWYLTAYYIIPWLICIPMGIQLEKSAQKAAA